MTAPGIVFINAILLARRTHGRAILRIAKRAGNTLRVLATTTTQESIMVDRKVPRLARGRKGDSIPVIHNSCVAP